MGRQGLTSSSFLETDVNLCVGTLTSKVEIAIAPSSVRYNVGVNEKEPNAAYSH